MKRIIQFLLSIPRICSLVCSTFAVLVFGASYSANVGAQSYPDHPITLVAPYPPGGTVDVVARALAQELKNKLDKPVIVDNRPGAGGTVGGRIVASAKPDGYTLLLASDGSLIAGPLVVSPAPYRLSAFTTISRFASSPLVLVTKATQPYQDIKSFIEAARAKPGLIALGSPGNGTPGHLLIERLQASAGIKLLHVPYKGGAQLMSDMMGEQINGYFCTVANCVAQIQAGSLRALGVSSAKRSRLLPSVATFAEQGVKDLTADNWFGVAGPADMPAAVTAALEVAVAASVASPSFQKQMRDAGIDMVEQRSPKALAAELAQESSSLAKLLADRPLNK